MFRLYRVEKKGKQMTSKILGRTTCPIRCGHEAAHVKIKTDKASGTAFPYVHCRACGWQGHTKNEEQAGHLLAITRPEKLDDVPKEAKAAQIETEKVQIPVPQISPEKYNEIQTESGYKRRFGRGFP
jgi:hypothetical protein